MRAASDSKNSLDFELNLAPIIDCFTVLIAFILISASFASINILDAGIAFKEVNLESLAIVLKKGVKENDTTIYQAQPIKRYQPKKQIKFIGLYDNRVLSIGKILPLIGLSSREVKLLLKLNKNVKHKV